MTERNTIKRRVERLLDEGLKLETTWHHIQAQFPHNSCSWNYMRGIERDWVRSKGEKWHQPTRESSESQ